jgi:hypothetical protein
MTVRVMKIMSDVTGAGISTNVQVMRAADEHEEEFDEKDPRAQEGWDGEPCRVAGEEKVEHGCRISQSPDNHTAKRGPSIAA